MNVQYAAMQVVNVIMVLKFRLSNYKLACRHNLKKYISHLLDSSIGINNVQTQLDKRNKLH